VTPDEWYQRVARGYYRHAQRLPRPTTDWRGLVATLAVALAALVIIAVVWP
jgi:hypothetical protein